jgi:Kef-type K+ transport system membrane component KefB
VLTEKRKSDSPEGVTVMSAAILDDVLGIVLLAVAVGIVHAEKGGGRVSWADIGLIAAKAFGFWIVCTGAALLAARRISRLLKLSRTPHVIASVSLGLALLLAGLSEMAGLAMIIGAYIMGLSLSRTDLVQLIRTELEGIYKFLVPAFFCVMGMLVNVAAMKGVVVFGLVYTVLAIISKVAGCGLPAWWMNFNLRGALRIGIGMVPRGEVALIMAGVGLASGAISSDILGVAVMMTMISTLIAPVMLIKSFEGGAGVRGDIGMPSAQASESVVLDWPAPDLAEWMMERLAQAFRREEFFVYRLSEDVPSYQVRKDLILITLTQEGPRIILTADTEAMNIARFIVLEELIQFQSLFESIKDMRSMDAMRVQLITDPSENNGQEKNSG